MKNCPCCDSENISIRFSSEVFTFFGNQVEIMALIFICVKCDESFFSKTTEKKLSRILAKTVSRMK
jgi:YgiT-type zinc finger domain-containing protein